MIYLKRRFFYYYNQVIRRLHSSRKKTSETKSLTDILLPGFNSNPFQNPFKLFTSHKKSSQNPLQFFFIVLKRSQTRYSSSKTLRVRQKPVRVLFHRPKTSQTRFCTPKPVEVLSKTVSDRIHLHRNQKQSFKQKPKVPAANVIV